MYLGFTLAFKYARDKNIFNISFLNKIKTDKAL